jgi:recombination protein RecA
MGVAHNFIEKSGSWYAYNGERIGQGKENARTYLEQNPAIAKDIEAKLRAKLIVPTKRELLAEEARKGEAEEA